MTRKVTISDSLPLEIGIRLCFTFSCTNLHIMLKVKKRNMYSPLGYHSEHSCLAAKSRNRTFKDVEILPCPFFISVVFAFCQDNHYCDLCDNYVLASVLKSLKQIQSSATWTWIPKHYVLAWPIFKLSKWNHMAWFFWWRFSFV